MAVYLSDVLRCEAGETGLHFALRNRQDGFATDTRKLIHKFTDGSVEKYLPESLLAVYGQTGVMGLPGATGVIGLKGSTGMQGATGLVGAASTVPGPQGDTGAQGYTGLQGIQGIQGATGVQGIQGIQGATGVQGIQGIQGATGLQGAQGIQGDTGVQGIQGATGVQGIQGETGLSGTAGYTGMRITNDGTLQVRYLNTSGATIYNGFLLCVDEDGVTGAALCLRKASEDSERIVGVSDHIDTIVNNGEWGWCTVKGITKALTGYNTTVNISAGDIIGQAPTYALANAGRISGSRNNTWKGIGYALEGSTAADELITIYFNGPTFGIQNFYYAPIINMTGVPDDVVLLTYVIDGGAVNMKIGSVSVDNSATDTAVYLTLPNFLKPSNDEYLNVCPGTYNFVNHNTVLSDEHLVAQFDSTNGLDLQLWKNSAGTLDGWTGTCGWYSDFNISYIKAAQ